MILLENQKLQCKICGEYLEKQEDIMILPSIEANEMSLLFFFNEAIVHRKCFEKHPLKSKFQDRVKKIELLSQINRNDFITNEEVSIDKLGHPDNLIKVFYITDDENSPLYLYNGILLNKRNLKKWEELPHFITMLEKLDSSGQWKGNAIKNLIIQLKSSEHPPYSENFLQRMKERYNSLK